MLDRDMLEFVRRSLPPAPARVLEVGAGDGELAGALVSAGYDVVAIDPSSGTENVEPIALHQLSDPPASFDAALAVLSMHHVEPLAESCRRLGQVVRQGGALVLDEIDFDRFDERAAQWWLDHHEPIAGDDGAHENHSPGEIVAHLRAHCHPLADVQAALAMWFELGEPARGPYLYRWELSPELRDAEMELIAAGRLPATGARLTGTRR